MRTFISIEACLQAWAARIEYIGYVACYEEMLRRHRERQKQKLCDRCKRWKFSDQRCNLFVEGHE